MRKLMNLSFLLLIVVVSLSGCFDREPLFRPTKAVEPTPPESTWVCDTTWTKVLTNTASVNTSHRTATRIELVSITCDQNLFRYGARVTYSDTYDQKLQYYFERLSDSNIKYYFTDSLGRTTIPQPANYKGDRYMVLSTGRVPPGQYALRMYYAGTISSPSMVQPLSVYGTNWNVDAPIDTLHIGCINCRQVPK